MFNRVLLIALTSAATCGLSTVAIAQNSQTSVEVWDSGTLVSQATDNESAGTSQQPSAAIQSLQSRLLELGYYSGPVTGVFNSDTRDALAQFQQEQGLVGTGILDPLTQQRLADPTGAQVTAEDAVEAAEETEPSPTLDLPPVSESGESLEPEPPPAETDANSAAAEAPTVNEGEASVPASEVPPPTPDEGGALPVLILIGAIILVLGGIAGGAALWLVKRRGQTPATSDAQDSPEPEVQQSQRSQQKAASPAQAPRPAQVARPAHSPSQAQAAPSYMGPSGKGPASLNIQPPQTPPLGNVPESRVTKVNIIDELIQDLEQPDPEVRRRAIWELGQRGNSAAMHPLVGLLTQVDSREQSLILAALAEITSQTLKPMNRAVMIALQSEDVEVRKNAIRDLTKIFDSFKQSGKMLGHAALDEDPDVKQTADWALDQLNKMKPSSPNTAGFLGESDTPRKRLPDDGHSS